MMLIGPLVLETAHNHNLLLLYPRQRAARLPLWSAPLSIPCPCSLFLQGNTRHQMTICTRLWNMYM